jgi:hypothetical protein
MILVPQQDRSIKEDPVVIVISHPVWGLKITKLEKKIIEKKTKNHDPWKKPPQFCSTHHHQAKAIKTSWGIVVFFFRSSRKEGDMERGAFMGVNDASWKEEERTFPGECRVGSMLLNRFQPSKSVRALR